MLVALFLDRFPIEPIMYLDYYVILTFFDIDLIVDLGSGSIRKTLEAKLIPYIESEMEQRQE